MATHLHTAVAHHGIAGGNAALVAQVDFLGQVEGHFFTIVLSRLAHYQVAIFVAQVDFPTRCYVFGSPVLSTQVPAAVGNFLNIIELTQVDRVIILGAIGQVGDLVVGHVDAVAVDHRPIIDGNAVQIGQILRHDQVELFAVAIDAQVGASGVFTFLKLTGEGQRLAQLLGDVVTRVASKDQTIVHGRDFTLIAVAIFVNDTGNAVGAVQARGTVAATHGQAIRTIGAIGAIQSHTVHSDVVG